VEESKVNKATNESDEGSKQKAADPKGPNFDSEDSFEEDLMRLKQRQRPLIRRRQRFLTRLYLNPPPHPDSSRSTDIMPVKPL
jgi:hypothetical protein